MSDGANISVTTFHEDIEHLEWQTISNIVGKVTAGEPLPRDSIEGAFRVLVREPKDLGTLFANPKCLITANQPSEEFLDVARQAQHAWLRSLRQILGNRGCRHAMREASPLRRQLAFTGVLICGGKHFRNDSWPTADELDPDPEVKFGRLTRVEVLPGGRWRCLCTCGREKVIRREHLRSGRTKSCGCLRAELDAKLRLRRARRAR
ncbi:MAG TPA: hypothetical protein VG713_08625 [Pirellulales bacterium]|nr:hypothetical protein [Pirellulales bacterium]